MSQSGSHEQMRFYSLVPVEITQGLDSAVAAIDVLSDCSESEVSSRRQQIRNDRQDELVQCSDDRALCLTVDNVDDDININYRRSLSVVGWWQRVGGHLPNKMVRRVKVK